MVGADAVRVKIFHFATVATMYTHQYSIPPLSSQSKPSKSEDFGYENHPTACLFEFAIKTQLDLLSSCCGTRAPIRVRPYAYRHVSPDSGQDTSELEYSLRLRDPYRMDQTSEGE